MAYSTEVLHFDRLDHAHTPARVVLGDHDLISRAGVRLTLQAAGFGVCAESEDAAAVMQACLEHRPDVCVLDLRLRGDALAATRQLTGRIPELHIVVLTSAEQPADLLAALEAGAAGYLLKEMQPDRLPHVLRRVLEGEVAVPRKLVTALADEVRRGPRRRIVAGPIGSRLTLREQQVLELLASGLGTSPIGERLRISPITVRRHTSSLVAKLGVVDRHAAARLMTSGDRPATAPPRRTT